jgi:hypothetical protein
MSHRIEAAQHLRYAFAPHDLPVSGMADGIVITQMDKIPLLMF